MTPKVDPTRIDRPAVGRGLLIIVASAAASVWSALGGAFWLSGLLVGFRVPAAEILTAVLQIAPYTVPVSIAAIIGVVFALRNAGGDFTRLSRKLLILFVPLGVVISALSYLLGALFNLVFGQPAL